MSKNDKINKEIINNGKILDELLKDVKNMNKDAETSIEDTEAFIKQTEEKMKALGIKF
jgi:hypothetical protein